ncbi:MAG TPA: HPF/RaiA family ribosome-associated protein [Candidatus Ornithospirochaeta avicola]|uniref:HPF/RaiA family ribosome-associated protein n=1 Tax=Candidatus Ornithospirochaeta avicola TaxID=2840896 RepID=A0A9D1PUH4_9SPIO|nr:HPF/RaiA family ribosome-associated protein [Candidatus Ornithospirochaeta avicola]
MNLTIRGVNYVPSDETKTFIDKKLKKLAFADDYLQDLELAIKRESKGIGYHIDAIMHFSWKKEKVVSQDCYELYEGIELIADKIQSAAKKEKEKTMGI